MHTHPSQSQPRDSEDTDDLRRLRTPQQPTSAMYSVAPKPPRTLSGVLTTALCVAVLTGFAASALAVIGWINGGLPLPVSVLMLLTAVAGVAWQTVVNVHVRDVLRRHLQVLHANQETLEARQLDIYRRQDHCAGVLLENARIVRQLADDVRAIRDGMKDVLEIQDANAELGVRQQASHRNGRGLRLID